MSASGNRWMGLVLTVSLMVNTLLVGLFIGRALGGDPGPPPHTRGGEESGGGPARFEQDVAESVMRSVDVEQRTAVRQAMVEALREARPRLAERRQARRALYNAMVADPFVEADLVAAFEGLRTKDAEAQAVIHTALSSQFATLTPEQRRAVANNIRGGRRGRWDRQRRDDRNNDRRPGEER